MGSISVQGSGRGAGGGANKALSNLANVAINTDLLPVDNTISVGTEAQPFKNTFTANIKGISATRDRINTALNAFRLCIIGVLPKIELMDGMADAFISEVGVDTGASANESYDAGNDLYSPSLPGGFGSNVVGSGTASADQEADGVASKAFDDVLGGDFWDPGVATTYPVWLKYDFGSGNEKQIEKVRMVGWESYSPKDFLIQGSNNDSDWTTLKTISGESGWDQTTYMEFTFTNAVSYRYMRFWITDNVNAAELYCRVQSVQMMEPLPPNNMTLISNSTEAEANPDEIIVTVFEEDVDSVTINTDIKVYASRDDGSNYVLITLEDKGDYESGKRILTGIADVSGQASDKTIRYKIESLNNKDLKIHGAGMLWG